MGKGINHVPYVQFPTLTYEICSLVSNSTSRQCPKNRPINRSLTGPVSLNRKSGQSTFILKNRSKVGRDRIKRLNRVKLKKNKKILQRTFFFRKIKIQKNKSYIDLIILCSVTQIMRVTELYVAR